MGERGVPPALAARDQWICWRNECRECGQVLDPSIKECPECEEKTTKRPVNPHTGGFAKSSADDMETARETWSDLETAVEFDENNDTHGIGFVFDEDGPVAGVDFDDVRDPETGEIDDWVVREVRRLNSYSEVSPSGTGVHSYVFGDLPEDGGNRGDQIEIYDRQRYFTVSGDKLPQSPASINYREEELAEVQEERVGNDGDTTFDAEELEDIDIPAVDAVGDKEFTNDLGMSLDEVREREPRIDACLSEPVPDYNELDGDYENPEERSQSEYDFSAAGLLWFWRFSKQQIVEIFHKYRYRPKVKRPSTYLGAANGERYDPRPTPSEGVEILENRSEYTSIGAVNWPDGHFVLDKPPREGGSHASMDQLSDEPLIVLASRHSIAEHHLEILDKVMPEGATAVHLVGGGRACDHSGGGSCPNAVTEYRELLELKHAVMDIVEENRTVTYEDAPEKFCNKQFVNEAAEYAHAVVTVPNLLPEIDRSFDEHNLLIDEEQALGYFRTPSVDIATIETVYDPDGTRRVQAPSAGIVDELDTLIEVRERIREDQQERAEENDSGEYRETAREKDILNAIAYLEEVADTIAIDELSEEMDRPGAGEIVREIRERLCEIDVPEPKLSPANFRGKIEEYVERYYFDDSVSPGAMIESVLFGYDDRKFDFKFTGGGYKLRMIGGREVFHADTLTDFERIGIIAGPEGELLLNDLGIGDESEVIDITDFKYADDFVIVPIAKEQEGATEPVSSQRRRSARVSKELNRKAHPHIAVAGTKERAAEHHGSLVEGIAEIISSPDNPALDIDATWTTGGTAVIYENSAVSRGIDAPQMDISVVVDPGFATPYWEARKAHYKDEDQDEYEYARSIERQLKSHELTNAVLRPSPTRYVDDITGTKFIVCADWDAPRIRYVNQETPKFSKPETASNFVRQLTVGGGIRREQEMIYEHSGTERDYIETTMREEFKEQLLERPEYDITELQTWVNNRYLTGGETLERVDKAVPPTGQVPTSYISDLFSSWNLTRVKTALDVLERKGILDSSQKSDGKKGRNPTVWERRSLYAEDG